MSVGSIGASLVLWIVGFLVSYASLLVLLELGTMFPRSGGEKVYLEAMYKRPRHLATMFYAFQAILLGFTASGCIVFAKKWFTFFNIMCYSYSPKNPSILIVAGLEANLWNTRVIALGGEWSCKDRWELFLCLVFSSYFFCNAHTWFNPWSRNFFYECNRFFSELVFKMCIANSSPILGS